MHKKTQLLSINFFLQLIVLYCFCLPLTAHADTNSGVTWLIQQSQEIGSYSSETDIATPIQATAEAWRTLSELGHSPATQPSMSDALAFLKAEPFPSTEYLARQAIVRIAANEPVDTIITELTERLQYNGGLGDLPDYGRTVVDTAFALEAIALANFANTSIEKLYHSIDFILKDPIFNLGYAKVINDRDPLAMYVTAITMRSLWHYRHHVRHIPSLDIEDFLEKAQTYLLRELESANHETFENALALIAIIPQLSNIDPVSSYVETLKTQQLENGSWDNDVYTTALALRVLNTSIQPITNPDFAKIKGKIIDNQTDSPLPAITITLSGVKSATQTTNELGQFEFTHLDEGEYIIEVSDNSGVKITSEISLAPGETLDLNELRLLATTNTTIIQGNITNSITKQPIENVAIAVIGINFNQTLLTDNLGAYFLIDVPEGDITLEINQAGYLPISSSIIVEKGSTAVVPLELSPTSTSIAGTITDAQTGEPLSQATISVGGNVVASTNETGQYRVDGVSGEFTVIVGKDGYDSIETTVTIETNTNLTFSPKLYLEGTGLPTAGNASIRATVIDEVTNNVLSDVSVTCKGDTLNTNGLGQFTCMDLPAGEALLELSLVGYHTKVISVDIKDFTLVDIGIIPLTPENPSNITGIKGIVMDSGTRQLLIDTTVKAQFGSDIYSGVSSKSGRLIIEIPTSFSGDVILSVEGYKPINFSAELHDKDVLDLGFILLHPLGIEALLPDLTGKSFDPNTLTTDLDTLDVIGDLAITLENKGTAATTKPITVHVFNDVNLNGKYDVNKDTLLGQAIVNDSLVSNAELDLNIAINGKLAFRDSPINVVVDYEGQIIELNKNNNLIKPLSVEQCSQSIKRTLDLTFCIDGSGSVEEDQFKLQVRGIANIVENADFMPHDNSVRLSIIQFDEYTRVEMQPTFINTYNVYDIADKIRNIEQSYGGTKVDRCIERATSVITSEPQKTDFRIINLITDGGSNFNSAVNASLAAQEAGIDVLNGVAIGAGNIKLLDALVFPQPSGSNQGYVTSYSNYEDYVSTLGSDIRSDTKLGSIDLTASRLHIAKNYHDNTASLHMRVGKAGNRLWPSDITVTFWEGHPEDGGRFLGRVPVSIPLNSEVHYQDIQLDGVVGLSTGKKLYAIINPEDTVPECNKDNNTVSTQIQDFTGNIEFTLDNTEYGPNSPVRINYTVTNQGILTLAETLPSDFTVNFMVQNALGETVITLPTIDIATLNAGDSVNSEYAWNTKTWLTAAYYIKAELTNSTGQVVDEESKLFTIVHGEEAVIKFTARTDRPTYHSRDVVQIDTSLYNQSLNQLIDDALIQVIIKDPTQKLIYTKTRAISAVAPNGIQEALFPYKLYDSALGIYSVEVNLLDHDSNVLATENTNFEVTETVDSSITGFMSYGKSTDTERGFTYYIDHNGGQAISNVPIRYVLFDIDEQKIVLSELETIGLDRRGRYIKVIDYYTALLPHANYASILQVKANDQWQTLDFKPFILHHGLSSQCSKMYGVHDEGTDNSQLFTYDIDQNIIAKLGPVYPHRDIEGMDINPKTHQLYASTGRRNSQLYLVDGHTGDLTPIGLIGFDHVTALSFDRDGKLWGWSSQGLITIDIHTGQGKLFLESDLPIEGIAWDKSYSSYLYMTSYSFKDKSSTLWLYNNSSKELTKKCSNIPGEIESLELIGDSHEVIFGTHNDNQLTLHAYDTKQCEIIKDAKITTPFNDVEAIAWPSERCTWRENKLKERLTNAFESGGISVSSDGKVYISLPWEFHVGKLSDTIEQGEPPVDGELQLIGIADANDDGMSDFLIIYPDGARQILYYYGNPNQVTTH